MPRLPALSAAGAGPPLDLRVVLPALSGWAAVLAVVRLPGWGVGVALAVSVVAVVVRRHRGRSVTTLLACLVAATAVGGGCAMRAQAHREGTVAALAGSGSVVTATARITSDPVARAGRFGGYTLTRAVLHEVVGRGRRHRVRSPVLVIGDPGWQRIRLGSVVRLSGRLGPAAGPDLAAVVSSRRAPRLLEPPGRVLAGAETVRAGIREAVAPAPPAARALVPALVVGDDGRLPEEVVADMRTCGLTHLAAVSGTNLTLVVGFLLVVGRRAGVRARGLRALGLVGVLCFVLLARPEPSVLRAAAMGSVALLGLGPRGPGAGVRGLGAAVLVLLLLDPWLGLSVGFLLSTLATAGILFLGPPFRDALARWLPRVAAEGLAVPLAAQLACTPAVAAVSGQVSLVAVVANLVVAPAVAPATVLGLLGGLVVLVTGPAGHLLGATAGLCGSWIVLVATRLAALPTAAVDWRVGVVPIGLLGLACLAVALGAGRLLSRPGWSLATGVLMVVVLVRPLPSPGWPPAGWVMVACDVGQGDGLVLNAGGGRAVVVDVGPDPRAMDRCLGRLEVRTLPVVVLTHFHADHIDGLAPVLADHRTAEVDVTATEEPQAGARQVHAWAETAHVPVRVPTVGEVRRVGALTWQVLGPLGRTGGADEGEEGSTANNASLVLLVQTRGIRLLLTGDMEPEAQQALARALPGLRADVLKVPHHGSRYQDPDLLSGLGARLAVISVGAGNDFGHPAPPTLSLLRQAGMRVARTDRDGDVAVTVRHGRLGLRSR